MLKPVNYSKVIIERLRLLFFLSVFSFMSFCPALYPQNEWKELGKTGEALVKAPGKFSASDNTIFSGVILSTGIAFFFDENIRSYVNQLHSDPSAPIFDKMFWLDKYYGNWQTAIPIALIYSGGVIADDSNVRRTGMKLISASIYTIAITSIFKSLIGRSRPYRNESNKQFNFFEYEDSKLSFPSGHSSWTFAIAAVLETENIPVFYKILGFSTAGLTALARIYHDQHWLSDVIAGAALGYFIGRFSAKLMEPAFRNSSINTVTIPEIPVIQFAVPIY